MNLRECQKATGSHMFMAIHTQNIAARYAGRFVMPRAQKSTPVQTLPRMLVVTGRSGMLSRVVELYSHTSHNDGVHPPIVVGFPGSRTRL